MSISIEQGLASTEEGANAFITHDLITTGAIHWVDSVNGNDANMGSESEPLATLAQAHTNATANNGDIIVLKSGHTETLTTPITISKAGLRIFGIGNGSSKPKFTLNAAVHGLSITGAGTIISNIFFPAGTTIANSSRIQVDAAGVRILDCTFQCGQYDLSTIKVTANGSDFFYRSNTMTVTANGPDHGILVESASAARMVIENSAFDGGSFNWDYGAIYSAFAHLNFLYSSVTLTGDASIVHTANAKGSISDVIAGEGSTVSA